MEPWPRLPFRLGQQPSLLSSSSELLPSAIALLRDPAFSASLTLSCSGGCWQILMHSSVPLFLHWHLSLRETFLAFWYDPFTLRRCILAGIFYDLPLCPVLLPPRRYFPHFLCLLQDLDFSPAQPSSASGQHMLILGVQFAWRQDTCGCWAP